MAKRPKPGEPGYEGRPKGGKNVPVTERIRKDERKIADAVYRRALTGEPSAAEFCFAYAQVGHYAPRNRERKRDE